MSEKGKNILIATLIVIIMILIVLIMLIQYKTPIDLSIESESNSESESTKLRSTSYKVMDSCNNIYDCTTSLNIGTINGKKITATYDIKMINENENSRDNVIINGKIVSGDILSNITEIGIYRGKYIVIVKERNNIDGIANKVVEYYDEDLKLIKGVQLVENNFEIDSSVYDYYNCKSENQYTQNRMVINDEGEFSTSIINIEEKYCINQGEY